MFGYFSEAVGSFLDTLFMFIMFIHRDYDPHGVGSILDSVSLVFSLRECHSAMFSEEVPWTLHWVCNVHLPVPRSQPGFQRKFMVTNVFFHLKWHQITIILGATCLSHFSDPKLRKQACLAQIFRDFTVELATRPELGPGRPSSVIKHGQLENTISIYIYININMFFGFGENHLQMEDVWGYNWNNFTSFISVPSIHFKVRHVTSPEFLHLSNTWNCESACRLNSRAIDNGSNIPRGSMGRESTTWLGTVKQGSLGHPWINWSQQRQAAQL